MKPATLMLILIFAIILGLLVGLYRKADAQSQLIEEVDHE